MKISSKSIFDINNFQTKIISTQIDADANENNEGTHFILLSTKGEIAIRIVI